MKRRMSFRRLIDRYSSEFCIEREVEGELVRGRWVEGCKQVILCKSFVRNLTDKEVDMYGGGKFTTNDIKIRVVEDLKGYTLEEVGEGEYEKPDEVELEEVTIEKEDIIHYNNNRYKVDRQDERTTIADYVNYVASKQSVSQGVIEIV